MSIHDLSAEPFYFAALADGTRVLLGEAWPVVLTPSMELIVHPSVGAADTWTVTEASSGRRVAVGEDRVAAVANAKAALAAHETAKAPLRARLATLLRRSLLPT